VGQDQVPHIELSREIVRRFNNLFGDTFPEPEAKLTEAPLLVGLDGQNKMSKTLDNHLDLAATPEETTKRVLTAFTDPERVRRDIPGRPEVCNIYAMHKVFSGVEAANTVYSECTTAQRGCVDCKRHLADSINNYLKEMRARREDIGARPGYVQEILHEGGKKAKVIAEETIAEVYEKMGLG